MPIDPWHAIDVDATFAAVTSSPDGLSSSQAADRLTRDGPNVLSERRGASWVRKLAEQFLQPLVVVLLGAAALSIFLGDFVDAAVIAAVVVLNGLIGFFQEYRAEQSIAALSKTIQTEATVVRDGQLRRVPSEQLVRGDVVGLQSGDTVPADLRLIEVKDLKVEEAGLTGESVPSETLGSTTVICSDKTGTLTENQMTVTTVLAAGETFAFTGVGFDGKGELQRDGARVAAEVSRALLEVLRAGALCNDTRLVREAGAELKVEGDPTEAALTVAARKAGLDEPALASFRRLDVVPFESVHMYMASLHAGHDGIAGIDQIDGSTLYVKGSSDALLARCIDRLEADGRIGPFDEAEMHRAVDGMAARGLRVLVVARRILPAGARHAAHDDVVQLTFLGLVGMIDPPRAEAKRAVAACLGAGIKVKMITGDHAVTAAAIAHELGLEGARDATGRLRAVTGRELSAMLEAELVAVADDAAVFARVAPEQKLLLVRALQSRGHVVAMTGDGVNDAPALKQADIGVAMGKNGTDVARSASSMILTDDNFATIAAAVEEGRGIYDNLVKFIAWSLPTNGGEGLVLLAAVLLGTTLPVLPVQLLWVNLATALLGTTLIFEPHEPGLMLRRPRPAKASILDRALGIRTAIVSLAVGSAAFGCFEWAQWHGLSDAASRTIAVNTIVVVEVGYLFACRSLRLPSWKIGLFTNPSIWFGAAGMLGVQLVLTYVPIMNRLFHTAPIDLWWWGVMTAIGLSVFVLAETKKAWSDTRGRAAKR